MFNKVLYASEHKTEKVRGFVFSEQRRYFENLIYRLWEETSTLLHQNCFLWNSIRTRLSGGRRFLHDSVIFRSSPPEVFLREGDLKICSKFTGEHPCLRVVSIKLQSNFIKIALRHGCSPVNLLYISGTSFYKDTYGGLLLHFFNLGFYDLFLSLTINLNYSFRKINMFAWHL